MGHLLRTEESSKPGSLVRHAYRLQAMHMRVITEVAYHLSSKEHISSFEFDHDPMTIGMQIGPSGLCIDTERTVGLLDSSLSHIFTIQLKVNSALRLWDSRSKTMDGQTKLMVQHLTDKEYYQPLTPYVEIYIKDFKVLNMESILEEINKSMFNLRVTCATGMLPDRLSLISDPILCQAVKERRMQKEAIYNRPNKFNLNYPSISNREAIYKADPGH